MDMGASDALTRQFDDAAQFYDEVRPRYPETIVEQMIAFAGLPARGRLFEVGCGTGQMTLPLARRGYTIVAIDQGERLAALTAQHCQPYPRVRIVRGQAGDPSTGSEDGGSTLDETQVLAYPAHIRAPR
jgi:SAM-dependent methyltransferase